MAHHELAATPDHVHWGYFDATLRPVLTVDSGDTVTFQTVSGAPEYMPPPPLEVPTTLRRIHQELRPEIGPHIITGPVHVRGAAPRDQLEVEILDTQLDADWGWNVHRPGLGALPAKDFPTSWTRHLTIDRRTMTARLPWGRALPLRPFFGILAVSPPEHWGRISSKPPNAHGGNMDNKELIPGSRVFLPVFNEGAGFSVGDGHAVQGDGEVNLTALETCLSGTFRLTVRREQPLTTPRAITPTHYVTTGFDPDLDVASESALRDMIQWLTGLLSISAEDAYMLSSLAVDLRITQVVDGNKGVHAMIERSLVD